MNVRVCVCQLTSRPSMACSCRGPCLGPSVEVVLRVGVEEAEGGQDAQVRQEPDARPRRRDRASRSCRWTRCPRADRRGSGSRRGRAGRAQEDRRPGEPAGAERPRRAQLDAPRVLEDARVDVVEAPAEEAALRRLLAAQDRRRLHPVADDLIELVPDVRERRERLSGGARAPPSTHTISASRTGSHDPRVGWAKPPPEPRSSLHMMTSARDARTRRVNSPVDPDRPARARKVTTARRQSGTWRCCLTAIPSLSRGRGK